ncbi:MAG: NAD(P)/FAD-dependent oxidoreductase [Dehalococcoidia bacterium]|nr:NAD(P)/FAD-dependent oxidoreductase [Dehalococcoidia bacterium]
MSDKRYDVIIIGAGPNGLELGAYLSRCGVKVLLLEHRAEVGGGLATEEVTLPDYLHNTHAVYFMMADYAPVYQDFQLEKEYNIQHIYPSLQFVLPVSDGRAVCLYSDVEKTCQSIAQFSKHDAEAYRNLYHLSHRLVDEFIAPATYVPPVPALDQMVRLQQLEVGRELAEYSEKTPKEIVDEFFEDEHVKALMLYVTTQWGLGYDDSAMGYLILLYLNRATNYRLVRGGSHMVAQALNKIIHENDGYVRTNQRIQRIVVTDNTASGVELEDGTIIHADKGVVSTIDPLQTFIKLVGQQNLSSELADNVKNWQWEAYSLLGMHLALAEAPDFTAAAQNPDINRAFVYVLGYETAQELIDDYETIYQGGMGEKACYNCCFPSVHDPSQAPPGRHTGLLSRFAPYRLKESTHSKWYDMSFKQELTERALDTLQKYAPNMTRDKVLWSYVSTPVDVENKFPDMVEGSIKQGKYTPFQMGYLRPNELCSQTSTPINNLYMCGASCYPGGCVLWGGGYLAANYLTDKLGVGRWWSELEIVTRAREKGLL